MSGPQEGEWADAQSMMTALNKRLEAENKKLTEQLRAAVFAIGEVIGQMPRPRTSREAEALTKLLRIMEAWRDPLTKMAQEEL